MTGEPEVQTLQRSIHLSSLDTDSPACPHPDQFLVSNFSVTIFDTGKGVTEQLLDHFTDSFHPSFCLELAADWRRPGLLLPVAALCGCSGPRPCLNICPSHPQPDTLGRLAVQRVSFDLHCPALEYPGRLWALEEGGLRVDTLHRQPSEYCILPAGGLLLCPAEDTALEDGGFRATARLARLGLRAASAASVLLLIVIHLCRPHFRSQRITQLKLPFYASLFLSFLGLTVTHFIDLTPHPDLCLAWALLHQFLSLSIFCWLATISLDIWLTFRRMRNIVQQRAEQARRLRQVRALQAASLFLPLALTLGTLLAQLLLPSSSIVHPNIGEAECFLGRFLPQLLYFHTPILVLLLGNIGFYSRLVYQLTFGLFNLDNKEIAGKLRVFLEFLVIMGLNWLSEIVVFLVEWRWRSHPALLTLTIMNQLSGVWLLLVFLARRPNREWLCGTGASGNATPTTPLTSAGSGAATYAVPIRTFP
jgi:hypothetical protein